MTSRVRDRRGVVFATPVLEGYAPEHRQSALSTVVALSREAIPFQFIEIQRDQYLARARNLLVATFLAGFPDADNLFFIDSDVGWGPQKVVEFLDREEPILLGVPPAKLNVTRYPFEFAIDTEGCAIERDGLIKVTAGPAGFMRIKRRSLEEMAARARWSEEPMIDGNTIRAPEVFWTGIGPTNRFVGEDFSFIRRCAEMGIEAWADPDIEFTHRGTYVWQSRLKDNLQTLVELKKKRVSLN